MQNHLLEGVPKARQVYQFPNHTFSLLIKYLWLERLTEGAKWLYCVEDYNFSGKMASGPYNYSYIFKYIIIGDMGVGKSCLLHQFTEKKCKKNQLKRLNIFWLNSYFSYGRLPPHHRSGVWYSDHRGVGTENQVTDLGHCWAGEVRREEGGGRRLPT